MNLDEYTCKLNDYFLKFYSLNPDSLAKLIEGHDIHDGKGNVLNKEDKDKIVDTLKGITLLATTSIIGTPVKLTLDAEDMNKMLSITNKNEAAKSLRELSIKSRQATSLFMFDIKYDKIRDKAGDEENIPFEMWDRCIKAYMLYVEYKQSGKKRFYHLIADKLDYKGNVDNATDKIQEDIKTVSIFIERAVNGTFPYDVNGQWEYRCDFKNMKL